MNTTLKLALAFSVSCSASFALAGIHPDVTLLDSAGQPVGQSNLPLSTEQTCGDCHDTGFIAKNHDHPPHIASNCLLCHSENYDAEAYFSTRQSTEASWAAVAGITQTALVNWQDDGWHWSDQVLNGSDEISAEQLGIKASDSEVCAQCHGIVHNSSEPLTIVMDEPIGRLTLKEGAIFSGQRLSDTALSVVGDVDLHRTFDIHAERLVECTDCHRAANNPVHGGAHGSNLSHLAHDPRQADLSEFLERPDHNLIIGVAGGDGNCKGCHEPEENHSEWLPDVAKHFEALTCQACHITELFGPAKQWVDNSLRDEKGQPIVLWRSVDATTHAVSGFKPLLLQRPDDGKFAPYNVTLTRYWRDAQTNSAVDMALVSQAWQNTTLPAATTDTQLSPEAIAQMTVALQNLGIAEPQLANKLEQIPINHGVSRDQWAQKDCQACHSEDGVFQAAMPLAPAYEGFTAPASLLNEAAPAMTLITGSDNVLYAISDVEVSLELSQRAPTFLIAGSFIGLLGFAGVWRWLNRHRR